LVGDLDGARDLLQQTLTIAREIRDDHAESLTLRRLGITFSELGQHDGARACLADALAMARATGRAEVEGVILLDLGTALVRAGQPDEAAQAFEQSIAIFRKFGLDQFRQRAEHELDLLGQRTA
jgi:tetratricopeptide (TPR) repeat protein